MTQEIPESLVSDMKESKRDPIFEQDTTRRLATLADHMLHIIHPMRAINEAIGGEYTLKRLQNALEKPLRVDDKGIKDLYSQMNTLIQEFRAELKDYDMIKTLAEIKFIGKRVHEMEEMLKSMCSEGVTHKMSLQMTMDGYEMVKKTVNHQKEDKVLREANYTELERELLEYVENIRQRTFMLRAGLLGNEVHTYVQIGKQIDRSPTTARNQMIRSVRLILRDKTAVIIAKKLNNPVLNSYFGW